MKYQEFYEKLNLAIDKSLTNGYLKYELLYLDEIVKLANIIVENTPQFEKKNYNEPIPLNNSISMTIDFFDSLNPKYSYMFQNILQERSIYNGKIESSVKFYKILGTEEQEQYGGQHRENRSEVLKNGFVHIDYSETKDDVYSITHEITHKFSQPKNQNSTIKSFLGETSTITMEYLLQDFLNENDYNDENMIHKNNRFSETYDDACAIIFENILIRLYKENNHKITSDILKKYLSSLNKDSKLFEILSSNGEKFLNEIVKSGSLQFNKRQRYVIGTVLASDFHSKIKENITKKEELFYLIDILGHTDLMTNDDLSLLGKLDIPIIENGQLKIGEQSMNRLTNNYKKEIEEIKITKKNNSHQS
ncbi:MAG: hypothetical protein RR359_06055 [Bacilli bacterium]